MKLLILEIMLNYYNTVDEIQITIHLNLKTIKCWWDNVEKILNLMSRLNYIQGSQSHDQNVYFL